MKYITFVYEDPDENIVLNLHRINYCQISSSMIKISFSGQDLIILKDDNTEEGIEASGIEPSMNAINMKTKEWEGLKEILIMIGLKGE